MTRTPSKHEKATRLFLSGELSSTKQIASTVKVSPHTVERWRREGDWDRLRREIPGRVSEKLRRHLAGRYDEQLALQSEALGLVLVEVGAHLSRESLTTDDLRRLENVVARVLRGLARIREDRTRAA
jgi:hypothetical protein